jgi:DtxR family Mn-dependent transcriptional regulator
MLKRLAAGDEPLVDVERHGGARLTETGRRHALAVLRRHRLLETFLQRELGYAWDEVHEEADRLEHAVSDRFCEALALHLGGPETDPHGEPIPAADGSLATLREIPLSQLAPGLVVHVSRVTCRDRDLLRYLAARGLQPGVRLEVLAREPFGGSLKLRVAEVETELGPAAGAVVFLALPAGVEA